MPVNPHRGRFADRNLSRTQRLQRERLLLQLRAIETENELEYDVRKAVPEAWATLEQDIDVVEKKVQISIRLDESVAKFYRAMGTGYQGRINRVLATFAQMRMAQIKSLDELFAKEWAKVEAEGRKRGAQ